VFEPFVSFNQSYHLAPLYSVKGVHNVASIEHGKQTFHCSLRVPAVFPQDVPRVLNGANDGIVVGIVHDGTPTPRNQDSRLGDNFRSRLALRFYVSETNSAVARSVLQPRRLIKPARLGPASHEHGWRRAAPDYRSLASFRRPQ
jgi:hypothetical protein